MYKITFEMYSPLCFIDRPILDSILAYCYMKELQGQVKQGLSFTENELINFDALPLLKKDDYFLASIMFYEKDIEFLGSWKKRWDNRHDFLVNFEGKNKSIVIDRGEFKAYDVPKTLHAIPQVWFYFQSNSPEQVGRLIENNIIGIGKKISQGDGWFKSFKIEQTNEVDFDKTLLRPIPQEKTNLPGLYKNCAWKPPYWLPENMALCKYPTL